IDGDLLGACRQHLLGVRDAADASRHAEWDVQQARYAAHPGAVHRAALGARGDVVEHQFVRPLVAIAQREIEDIPDDTMVAEAHALDDLSVAHVEAGDYAFGKNGRSSSSGMSSSSSALPLIAAAAPHAASARKSRASRMPPEACHANC